MTAFISYSFQNKAQFDNVADALSALQVAYWNPIEIRSGSSLRDQLRKAVEECSVCIFVATRQSLDSSWCGAELGAFWGAGKPVVVYLADPTLKEADLPPQVQGDVWEERLSRLALRAKELIADAAPGHSVSSSAPQARIGNLTVEQLERMIVSAVSLGAASEKSQGRQATPEGLSHAAKGVAGRVLDSVRASERSGGHTSSPSGALVLWVDDNPDNNVFEREALEGLGIRFTLATSTKEALARAVHQRFAAIISDMGRREGPSEGYVLLEALRGAGDMTPFVIYAGSNAAAHKREAAARGAQGSTNRPEELFDLMTRLVLDQDSGSP